MEIDLRVGIHHQALFPASSQDSKAHEDTLQTLLEWPEFAVIDTCCEGPPERQRREAASLRASGKQVVYHVPLLGALLGCDPNALNPRVVTHTRSVVLPHLDLAAEAGATLVVLTSGHRPRPTEVEEAMRGWLDYFTWVGAQAGQRGLRVVVEPHDQGIDRNLLIGPTSAAVQSVEEVRQRGVPLVGLLMDMAHLALLCEPFADALRRAAPYLWHVHLSNAVMRDPMHEWFGDKHPPFGLAGSEHHTHHLASFLRDLVAVDYFDQPLAALTFEMQPYINADARQSALRWLRILEEACDEVAGAPPLAKPAP